MKFLTKAIEKKLRANSMESGKDHKPVFKAFSPVGAATWLFTELDDDNRLFGLCDLGFGAVELGYVQLEELMALNVGFGLKVERDLFFKADKTLKEYTTEALAMGRILV
jgi:hypothetical protein